MRLEIIEFTSGRVQVRVEVIKIKKLFNLFLVHPIIVRAYDPPSKISKSNWKVSPTTQCRLWPIPRPAAYPPSLNEMESEPDRFSSSSDILMSVPASQHYR